MSYAEGKARLAVIAVVAAELYNVRVWEHLIVDFLAMIKSGALTRSEAVELLEPFIDAEVSGGVELIEFTMRDLQWPEVESRLHKMRGDSDFRVRDWARRALEVYEPVWENGDIYATYDHSAE